MLKIGIIGSTKGILNVEKFINNYFAHVKTTQIEFNTEQQKDNIIKYLQLQEAYFDGIIFTGKIPYDILNHAIHSKNPWVYIENNHFTLLRILLKIAVTTSFDPCNISIDSYGEKSILRAYDEASIPIDGLKYYWKMVDNLELNMINILKEFHIHNYYENNVSVCITEITQVYEELNQEGIPCILAGPSESDIKKALKLLENKIRAEIDEISQIVVLVIEIDLPNEYSILYENEYQIMREKTKVTEKVYFFAQGIQATVIETSDRGYLLFSTKKLLEFETNNLEYIPLLDDIASCTSNTISVGIGYGTTAREANYNANLSMHKAKKISGNTCYKFDGTDFIGPYTNASSKKENYSLIIDENYLSISEITGISIETIFKIQCFIDQHKKKYCTPKELADYLQISKRSVNRILEKLELVGYMTVVGKKGQDGPGRPSRIVEISLDLYFAEKINQ